jgi:hypothetical protein
MDFNDPNFGSDNCNPNIVYGSDFYGNDFSNFSTEWVISSPSLKRPLEETTAGTNEPISSSSSASSSSTAIDLSTPSIIFEGYSYSKKEQFAERTSYRCKHYRCSLKHPVKPRCGATLMLHANGRMVVKNIHECAPQGSLAELKVDELYHAEDKMRALIESRINEDATKPAAIIAQEVWDEIHLKYAGIAICIKKNSTSTFHFQLHFFIFIGNIC